jgi:HEAT repeat protein
MCALVISGTLALAAWLPGEGEVLDAKASPSRSGNPGTGPAGVGYEGKTTPGTGRAASLIHGGAAKGAVGGRTPATGPKVVRNLVDELKKAYEDHRCQELKAIYARIHALGPDALPGLARILNQEEDPLLKIFAMNAIAGLRSSCGDLPAFKELCRGPLFTEAGKILGSRAGAEVRTNALFLLASVDREETERVLLDTVRTESDPRVRNMALTALGNRRMPETAGALLEMIETGFGSDSATRIHAARTALDLAPEPKRDDTSRRLFDALGRELESLLMNPDASAPAVRFAALQVFARIAPKSGNRVLVTLLEREENDMMLRSALGNLQSRKGCGEAVPQLRRLAEAPSTPPAARHAARGALARVKATSAGE